VFGTLGIAILISVAVGGVAYVFLYPLLTGERRVEQRMRDVATVETDTRRSRKVADPTVKRRQQVEDSLQQIEERRKRSNRPSLSVRLQQSGLTWTKRQFWIASAIAGLFGVIVAWIFGASILIALGVGFSIGIGLPRWMLSFLKKRREKRFLDEFPNGIDIIARREGRTPGRRLHPDRSGRGARASESRVPHDCRVAGDRHSSGRCQCPAVRTYTAGGSELLRHRSGDSAEVRRQPVGGAR
jgi:hypothetical protein